MEKLDIHPASAPRAKEMKREPGSKKDTEEPEAKEGSKEGTTENWQVD